MSRRSKPFALCAESTKRRRFRCWLQCVRFWVLNSGGGLGVVRSKRFMATPEVRAMLWRAFCAGEIAGAAADMTVFAYHRSLKSHGAHDWWLSGYRTHHPLLAQNREAMLVKYSSK